jgi:hypothetical protein
MAELAINSAKQASTGFSPYYLMYGCEPAHPIDLAIAPKSVAECPAAEKYLARLHRAWARARDNLLTAQQRQAHYANQHRRAVVISVGDKVLLSTEHLSLKASSDRTRKLACKFVGPFTVKRVVNDNAYELSLPPELEALHSTFNIDRLKLYNEGGAAFPDRPQPIDRPPAVVNSDNGAPEWVVERVVAKRVTRQRVSYLVKWQGYPEEEMTWEPAEGVKHLDAVREFNRRDCERRGLEDQADS